MYDFSTHIFIDPLEYIRIFNLISENEANMKIHECVPTLSDIYFT